MPPPLRRLTTAVLVLATTIGALAACGGDDRPSAAQWEPEWVAVQAEVPEPAEIDEGGEDVCSTALGELRASREELEPAPTPALGERVGEWLATAEGLMLDCPGEGDERRQLYEELEVHTAEIDAGLDIAADR